MSQVRISLAQMDVRYGNPRVNWAKMQEMSNTAVSQGGQMVIFPELWDAGFDLKNAKDYASSLSGGLFAQVSALSKQLGIFITGSMLEKRGMGIANCAAMISPNQGVMGAYRKIHLFSLMKEELYLTAGESTLNLNLPWGQTATAICYDLRFPELFRRYALEGAKMVVVPCQWPDPRMEHYRTLLRARAIENGIYIVAVNRVGTDVIDKETGKTTSYFGHSSVIDPWGNLVIEAGSGEGLLTVDLDLSMVDEVQRAMPILNDRRPETYGNY